MIMYELAEIFFDATIDNRKDFLKYPSCEGFRKEWHLNCAKRDIAIIMATTEIFQDWDSPYENLNAMRTSTKTTRKTTTTTTTTKREVKSERVD